MSSLETFLDPYGHTGSTFYLMIIDKRTGYIWNNVTKKLEDNPPRADLPVNASEKGSKGQYSIVMPSELPAGKYKVVIYKQLESAPSNKDRPQSTTEVDV